ncbi:hypothetical protein GCM10017688_05450 [Streptomyces ramulosus]
MSGPRPSLAASPDWSTQTGDAVGVSVVIKRIQVGARFWETYVPRQYTTQAAEGDKKIITELDVVATEPSAPWQVLLDFGKSGSSLYLAFQSETAD